jgi:hypothetical protein
MSRNPDALADGRNDELAGEAIAAGRGTHDFAGEQRRGRRRKDRSSGTRAGQKRRRGKPCCRGLVKNSAGICEHTGCSDPECVGGQYCATSGCACPAGDPPCDGACLSTTGYCGECGTRCVEGETCNGHSCQCGDLQKPCKSGETCVGGECVSCASPDVLCGGRCQTCPDPPQPVTVFEGGVCCTAVTPEETYCSCGTGANKCTCKDECFVTVDGSGTPVEEFCCSEKSGVVCDDKAGNVACCQDMGLDSCTACGYGKLGGKIGSYRRPR